MTERRFESIEIDFDVYQHIEIERKGFDDTPNNVLRRKFGLPDVPEQDEPAPRPPKDERAWSWKGVVLPHGTELKMAHGGTVHDGVVRDGKWHIDGHTAETPSAACKIVAGCSLNGWIYWSVKRPQDHRFRPLNSLRPTHKIGRRRR